jgi:hypothetical protein
LYFTRTICGLHDLSKFISLIQQSGKITKQLKSSLNPQTWTLIEFSEARDRGLIGKSQWAHFARTIGFSRIKPGPEICRRLGVYINNFLRGLPQFELFSQFTPKTKNEPCQNETSIVKPESIFKTVVEILLDSHQSLKRNNYGHRELWFRISWDKRRCGSGVFIVPIHKSIQSQYWLSAFPLHLWDGKESEIRTKCSSLAKFIEECNRGYSVVHVPFGKSRAKEVFVKIIASPDLSAALSTFDRDFDKENVRQMHRDMDFYLWARNVSENRGTTKEHRRRIISQQIEDG